MKETTFLINSQSQLQKEKRRKDDYCQFKLQKLQISQKMHNGNVTATKRENLFVVFLKPFLFFFNCMLVSLCVHRRRNDNTLTFTFTWPYMTGTVLFFLFSILFLFFLFCFCFSSFSFPFSVSTNSCKQQLLNIPMPYDVEME